MKLALALLISVFSMSVFAKDLSETIRDIEIDRNAKCTETKKTFGLCFGQANGVSGTCFYAVKFACTANDGDFGVKVKMRKVLGTAKVRKVIYL